MTAYQQYLQATARLLALNQRTKKHIVTVASRRFIVYPNVFSPKFFKDTEIFARHLPVTPGEYLCEIGCGCGAIGITAALKGAGKVLLLDKNRDACRTARRNVALHGLEGSVAVKRSDLFSAVGEDEFFDTAFWNTPFGYVENKKLTMLQAAVFDPQYRATEKFIKQGLRRAKRILIGFSSTLGKVNLLHGFCKEAGARLEVIHQEESSEILPVKFEIFEARL